MSKDKDGMVGTWSIDYQIKRSAGPRKIKASHQKTGQGCLVRAQAGIPEMPDEAFDAISSVLESIVAEVNGLNAEKVESHVAFLEKAGDYCHQLASQLKSQAAKEGEADE